MGQLEVWMVSIVFEGDFLSDDAERFDTMIGVLVEMHEPIYTMRDLLL